MNAIEIASATVIALTVGALSLATMHSGDPVPMPRPKPEIQAPIVCGSDCAAQQQERLKQIELDLKAQTTQARRMNEKLDALLSEPVYGGRDKDR